MSRTVIHCFLVLIVASAGSPEPDSVAAQQRPGAGGRKQFATKPGEVITPPDRGERWNNQLAVGDTAPEFKLPLLADKGNDAKSVSLHDLLAKRPVVLIFGSMTCPPFRSQLDGVDEVYEQFKDRAEFLFVYIREAHPDSVLSVVGSDGLESLLKIPQAADASMRTSSAAFCQRSIKLSMPIAVDGIDNAVGKAYAGWPNRMVVVGTDGKVVYASDPAPGGTNAERLSAWLRVNVPANR
jgi:hypothetical protein